MIRCSRRAHFPLAIRTLLVLLLLLPVALQAQADNDRARLSVEIIVFERTNNAGHEEERWPDKPGMPSNFDQAIEADSDKGREAGIRQAGQRRLGSVANRLNDASDYNVVVHRAWTLPERDRLDTPVIRLFKDERLPGEEGTDRRPGQSVFQDEHLREDSRADAGSESKQAQLDLARPLDGILRVYRNRYIHIATDLIFNPDITREAPSSEAQARQRARRIEDLLAGRIQFEDFEEEETKQPFVGYRLSESRRVRLGQLHYLDHPRYGVIVRVDRPE